MTEILRNSENTNTIICLCETWLDRDFPHSYLNVDKKHTVYRLDRKGKGGGGLAIIIPKHIKSARCNKLSKMNAIFESLVAKLVINKIVFNVGVFYRIPTYLNKNIDISALLACIVDTSELGTSFIGGDFNFPDISWQNLSKKHTKNEKLFIDTITECGYEQLVNGTTRKLNCLDLFFSTMPSIIKLCHIEEPFGDGTEFVSDHKSLFIETTIPVSRQKPIITKIRNFRKTDWDALDRYLLAFSWDPLFANCNSVNLLVDALTDFLSHLIQIYVPLARFSSETGFLPIWNKEIIELIDREKFLHRRNAALRSSNSLTQIQQNEKTDVTSEIRRQKKTQQLQQEENSLPLHNLRKFWITVNRKLKTDSSLPILINRDGSLLLTDSEKATALNNYFASNYSQPNNQPLSINTRFQQATTHGISFQPYILYQVLKNLPGSVSSGPDGIPSLMLKRLALPLAEPLSRIFQLSFETACVPASWKIAHIVPIPKIINSPEITDYRPISLTSNICKTIEKVISTELIKHCQKLGIFKKLQYGFLPGKSCELLLLNCVHKWLGNLANKIPIDLCFIDFAKAFEKMSHPKLLQKLAILGVHPQIINWIESYLQYRQHLSKIGITFSDLADAISGAAQGSNIAPILFIIFLFDLSTFLKFAKIIFYADDATIFAGVENEADAKLLQIDIQSVYKWSLDNDLPTNSKKTKVMHLGSKINNNFDYTMGDMPIEVVDKQLTLGVWIDPDLTFDLHRLELVKKCNQTVGAIKNSFRNRNIDKLTIMFQSLVRSKIEYCSSVWYPTQVNQVNQIESVQRKFTKWFAHLRDLSYDERLEDRNLETLEFRRLVHDLVLVYKLVHATDQTEFNEFFVLDVSTHVTRGHSLKLLKIRSLSANQHNFWSFRVVNLWNKLLNTTVRAQSAKSFRNIICKIEKDRLAADFESYLNKLR